MNKINKNKIITIMKNKKIQFFSCCLVVVIIFISIYIVKTTTNKNNDDLYSFELLYKDDDATYAKEQKIVIPNEILTEDNFSNSILNKLVTLNDLQDPELLNFKYISLIEENKLNFKNINPEIDETIAYIINNAIDPSFIIHHVLINLKSCNNMPKTINAISKEMSKSPLGSYMYTFETSTLRMLSTLRTTCKKVINNNN